MALGKKKGSDEQDVQKAPKKKIKLVDVAQNMAFALLGIVLGLVALIGICAANPGLSDMISGVLKSAVSNEKEEEPAALVYAWNEPAYPFDLESTDDTESTDSTDSTEDAADTEEKQVENTENASAPDEAIDTATETVGEIADNVENIENAVEAAAEVIPLVTVTDSDITEIIDDLVDETEEDIYTPEVVTGRSAYAELTPDVREIESESAAKQIEKTLGYGETGEGLQFDTRYYPYFEMLDDDLKDLYRQVYANTLGYNSAFRPIVNASMSEIKDVIESVTYDHPELFWLNTTFYTEFDYNGQAVEIDLSFYDSMGDLGSARAEFEAAANAILEGAAGLSNDYEKELYIHNALAERLSYKHSPIDQSAYSGIVSDHTVCAGYAKAFQYLMQKLGVPTYLCVGTGAGELHAWDIVCAEGEYFNVDCTWDDQDPTTYDYFNLSDRMNYMHRRMFRSVGLPDCTAEPALVIGY